MELNQMEEDGLQLEGTSLTTCICIFSSQWFHEVFILNSNLDFFYMFDLNFSFCV